MLNLKKHCNLRYQFSYLSFSIKKYQIKFDRSIFKNISKLRQFEHNKWILSKLWFSTMVNSSGKGIGWNRLSSGMRSDTVRFAWVDNCGRWKLRKTQNSIEAQCPSPSISKKIAWNREGAYQKDLDCKWKRNNERFPPFVSTSCS